ncbi:MAG TPA: hypothetical protein VIY86_11945 [Pirellulaceae bacterium]
MTGVFAALAVACLALVGAEANAQSPQLPNSVNGRWTWVQRGWTQTFSLEEIKANPDKTFTAKLTWWTFDLKCSIRDAAIVGRQTESGIAFDATTKCDVSFTAELVRGPSGWTGKAATTSGVAIVLDLKAD